MRLNRTVLAVLVLLAPSATLRAELKPGDAPPPIKVGKWIRPRPTKVVPTAKVQVVWFFSSWSAPCRQAVPAVLEAAQKAGAKATVTAISVYEKKKTPTDTSYYSDVDRFVKAMGKQMPYPVGVDAPSGLMAKTWLEASSEDGVPTAFIIDRKNRIAWIGHAMMLDPILRQILAGTFDTVRFAADRAQEKAAERKEKQLFAKFNRLAETGKYKEAVEELDRIGKAEPAYGRRMVLVRYSLLLKYDEKAAYAFGRELLNGELKDQSGMLWLIARTLLDETPGLRNPDYQLAFDLSQRAADLTKHQDANILTALAYAHFKLGRVDQAIDIQTKAIPIGDANPQIPDRNKQLMRTRLEQFKRAKGGS